MRIDLSRTPILTEELRSIVWIILPKLTAKRGQCRICACSDEHACEGGCAWVDKDRTLCTSCLPPVRSRASKPKRR